MRIRADPGDASGEILSRSTATKPLRIGSRPPYRMQVEVWVVAVLLLTRQLTDFPAACASGPGDRFSSTKPISAIGMVVSHCRADGGSLPPGEVKETLIDTCIPGEARV